MICPYCNAENDDSTDRCTTCLKHLPHVDRLASPIAAATPAAMELLEPITPTRPNQPVSSVQAGGLVLTAFASAIVVGGIYFAISRMIDIFLIFPIVVGIIIGTTIGASVKKRHIRNVRVVGICAVLAGLIAYGTKITCEAYSLRPFMVQQFGQTIAEDRGVTPGEGEAVAERALTPWVTVRVYLENLAEIGVRVGHVGSVDTSGAVITGIGLWLLLFLECALVMGFSAIGAVSAAVAPYCTDCQAWRKTEVMIRKHPSQAPQVIDLVRRQDWVRALSLPLTANIGDKIVCRVNALYCPKCQGGIVQVTSTVNGRTSTPFTGELSQPSMQALRTVDQPVAAAISASATP